MKEEYQSPWMDVKRFTFNDILTASGVEQENIDDLWENEEGIAI